MRHHFRRTAAPWTLAAALLTTTVGGCSEDFAPYSRLEKLRVLALRAEPVNPSFGNATTLDALVYSVDPAPLTFAWSWCPLSGPADTAGTCPVTDEQVQQLGTAVGASEPLPPLVLGTEATQAFKNVLPAAALAAICTNGLMVGQGAQPATLKLDCTGGFPIRFTLVVTQGIVSTTATTVLRLPIVEGATSNANPKVDNLVVARDSGPVPFASEPPPVLPRLKNTKVRVSVGDGESETYMGPDDDNNIVPLRERLNLSWFAETGDMKSDRTSFLDKANTIADAVVNEWKPQKTADYPKSTAKMIVVIRDNRGGVGWTSGTVTLEPTP